MDIRHQETEETIRIAAVNIHGLQRRKLEIRQLLEKYLDIKVLGVSETILKDPDGNKEVIKIANFNMISSPSIPVERRTDHSLYFHSTLHADQITLPLFHSKH